METITASVDTTCAFCGCGCSLRLHVIGNRIVSARPAANGPANRGALCVLGSYGFDFVHRPDRLTSPLVKIEGGFREVTWDEALNRVADEFGRIIASRGPDAIAFLGSSRCTNEENYVLQKLARAVVKTNNVDNGSRLYAPASLIGLGRTIGFPCSTNSLEDMEKSDAILVVGANPSACAPAVDHVIRRAVRFKGAKLVLIDPRETRTAAFAHVWLRPKVGSDVALLNAIAREIISAGLYDAEFLERFTDNFDAFTSSLGTDAAIHASDVSGVPIEDIEAAAQVFGKAERASIVFGDGICGQVGGAECVSALANLAMLTGNFGRQGGGLFPLKRENNAQGACDMGALPDFLPGYRKVDDSRLRRIFEERWGASLSASPGMSALQMMEQARKGRLAGMLIIGENPVAGFPDPSATKEALAALDFLVVADMFLTETSRLAKIVLPVASFAEKEGTFTNFEGRVQPVHKAIAPCGDSLPDLDIILRLAAKMGHKMPHSSPDRVMDEIIEVVPSYGVCLDQEADESDLEAKGVFSGTKRVHGGLFPTGFARFWPVEYRPLSDTPSKDYPLTLLTGAALPRFGSGTRTARVSRFKKLAPKSWIEIGQTDSVRFALVKGDRVRVVSPFGQLTTTVAITRTVPEGTAFMPTSFPESPVNRLFHMVSEPIGSLASVGRCFVRLERVSAACKPERVMASDSKRFDGAFVAYGDVRTRLDETLGFTHTGRQRARRHQLRKVATGLP